jgi:hypothetical protein
MRRLSLFLACQHLNRGRIFVRIRASSRFKRFLYFVLIDISCFREPLKMSSHSPGSTWTTGWRPLLQTTVVTTSPSSEPHSRSMYGNIQRIPLNTHEQLVLAVDRWRVAFSNVIRNEICKLIRTNRNEITRVSAHCHLQSEALTFSRFIRNNHMRQCYVQFQ